MLPLFYREVYQTWLNYLQLLHTEVNQDNFEQVHKYFYGEVMGLTEEGMDPVLVSRWRSLQTELHRLVRLLETDWLFCRSSRQSATKEQRLTVLRDRIRKIREYCQYFL